MPERRAVLIALPALLTGCIANRARQEAALSRSGPTTDLRSRRSRRFDTSDGELMVQACVGALQDLGFTIDESDAATGVVVGSKNAGAMLRAQVTLRPVADRLGTVVRATFQQIVPRPGAAIDLGRTLDDPALYQGFFERVAQSVFLTAHEI